MKGGANASDVIIKCTDSRKREISWRLAHESMRAKKGNSDKNIKQNCSCKIKYGMKFKAYRYTRLKGINR